ncbi:MAG: aminoglycoside phosphotransferase family protein, partial [Steroidobacteraceae bacterium]
LRAAESGFDNAMFRLGESFAVRLPRWRAAAELTEIEQRWLITLSDRLPLPIPVPLRIGHPGCGFPWRWSVVPWFLGAAADLEPPGVAQAGQLGEFLRALHTPAPEAAPRNPYRGVPLADRARVVEERLSKVAERTNLITQRIRDAWQAALAAPLDAAPTWIHGDLRPRNVLTLEGAITAIIDWGEMGCGDPATDLASFWMLLPDATARDAARSWYGLISPTTWLRARGWAIVFALALLEAGLAGNARNATMGERILRRI